MLKSGITHSTFQGLKSDKRTSCNLKTVMQLIYALDVTPQEFFDSPLFNEENLELD